MIDRRVQKTRKILSQALVSLILEKGYDAITIQDIIDRANVGRSTFYAHFENKDQLLLVGNENFRHILRSKAEGNELTIDFEFFFEHVAENYDLALAFFGKKGGHVLIDFFRDLIADLVKKQYKVKQNVSEKTQLKMLNYQADAVATSIIRLLTLWVEDQMPFSAQEMAEVSNKMIKHFGEEVLL
jgi:AcrR family transcriptional regulator